MAVGDAAVGVDDEGLGGADDADGGDGKVDDDHGGDDEVEENGSDASQSATILVMQESHSQSVWAYRVDSKGASETWVVEQIAEDLDTVGLRNDRIVVKSDQEASAQELS